MPKALPGGMGVSSVIRLPLGAPAALSGNTELALANLNDFLSCVQRAPTLRFNCLLTS